MCGRYYIDGEVIENCRRQWGIWGPDLPGDIHPSEKALVLRGVQGRMILEPMIWGFPQQNRTGLLINARAETVLEKVTFRDSARYRRCVIPAGHYYEWNRLKEKATFKRQDGKPMYMAGLYQIVDNEFRFVIITTEANASVLMVHDRMPLILEESDVDKWIFDDEYMRYLLRRTPVLLQREQEYEQQSLPLW